MSEHAKPPVRADAEGSVLIVTLDRPELANALDRPAADLLTNIVREFDGDASLAVAVLTGANGTFCAGADLKAALGGEATRASRIAPDGDGPLGPTRLLLSKPVIAAVEGHAVAGGLELALWCDLRVASRDSVLGVFCRRWGIPLMDGGTVRLPRLIGHSRALDMILTGRGVPGEEAHEMGLVNRLTEPGETLGVALALAVEISRLPQATLREDRLSSYEQWPLCLGDAVRNEYHHGALSLASGEVENGLASYAEGTWRGERSGNGGSP